MRTFSIDQLFEQIKNSKSKEYFNEVIRSYYSENYRSSIVMLYSIVICDLIFKLQELKDQFNDGVAKEILLEIENLQKRNPTNPQWETKLIELIKEKTNILEHSDYENIQHLQQHRHLCAHPVMLQNYQLFSPNRDTVRAHILNILEGLLTKPALLSKKIFDEFLLNLAEIKNILITEKEIEKHLNSKYFENLSYTVEKDIFRSLWKIVFMIENGDCEENREINYKALNILFNRNYDELLKYIKDENQYFCNNLNFNFFNLILNFLIRHPRLFDSFNSSAKTLITSKIEQNNNYKFLAWFLNGSLDKHLEFIQKNNDFDFNIQQNIATINELIKLLKEQGLNKEARSIQILMFSRSKSYDQADSRFDSLIRQNIKSFPEEEMIEIINSIQQNDQIRDRRNSKWGNGFVKEQMLKLNPEFDFTAYPLFVTF